VKLLLDEMYPASLLQWLQAARLDASTVAQLGLGGSPDAEVFAAAIATGHVLLTENVQVFAAIAAEHSAAGGHHPGLLITLSSRFSRRAAGQPALTAAIRAVTGEPLEDRVVYLERQSE
jgi:hypothetical protein